MDLERARLTLVEKETWIKMKLEKKKSDDAFMVEQKKVNLARLTEDSRIMLQDTSLLDD